MGTFGNHNHQLGQEAVDPAWCNRRTYVANLNKAIRLNERRSTDVIEQSKMLVMLHNAVKLKQIYGLWLSNLLTGGLSRNPPAVLWK